MEDSTRERWLAELHPAERLRYFSGRLLTADDFQKEQDYGRGKSELHNRFELGHGVVCGLGVTAHTTTRGNGVSISAGLAVDGLGREIVIPTDVDIVPLRLRDDCDPLSTSDELLPRSVHISLCYRELQGGEQSVSTAEPEGGADQEPAGSLIESYCLRVQKGTAPNVSTSVDRDVLEHLRSGRFRDALCMLAEADCRLAPADPCIVLANIEVGENGSLAVDACGPRAIVPTNRLLLQLAQSMSFAATPDRGDAR